MKSLSILIVAIEIALLIAIILLFLGCGGAHTKIDTHTVSREELYLRAGKPVDGWATWRTLEYVVYCDIWIMPINEYVSQEYYDEIMAHERRHCFDGDFHAE